MGTEPKRRLPRKIRDAAEAAIIGAATDFGQDRIAAGDSRLLAEAAATAVYPLIEREVRRQMAREVLHLHQVDRRCIRNVGPYGHMEVSLNKISRGEPLPDWRDLHGGEGANHG